MLIHATPLGMLEDQSDYAQAWTKRFARYDREAAEDRAMYVFFERNDMLPPPGRLPRAAAMRAWRAHKRNAQQERRQ